MLFNEREVFLEFFAKNLYFSKKHLRALRDICLLPCDELADLEKAIREYQAKN